jgi:hypothetical protein
VLGYIQARQNDRQEVLLRISGLSPVEELLAEGAVQEQSTSKLHLACPLAAGDGLRARNRSSTSGNKTAIVGHM